MGKNKLARWTELDSFRNVIQPETSEISGKDHSIKGKWHESVFSNFNPVVLELACGKGEYTTGLAGIFPERNYIGVDIKGSRMWRGAKTASERELRNTAFLRTRIEFISSFFKEDEVDENYEKPKKTHKNPGNSGWIKIFENVVGDDLVNHDRYAILPLHNVLRWMTTKIIENIKRK